MKYATPGSRAVILRRARGAPTSTAIAQQWYQQVRPGIVDSMQISWASVGPIVLMGRLLARVKSVSVAQKKNQKKTCIPLLGRIIKVKLSTHQCLILGRIPQPLQAGVLHLKLPLSESLDLY